jgi:hypothetical protein
MFVVFRDGVYGQQPVIKTVVIFGLSFLLGLMRHITPVISVVAIVACAAEQLP